MLNRSRSTRFGAILIKPEAIRAGVEDDLLAEFSNLGVNILCAHRFIATDAQLNMSWSDLPRERHPLEHAVHDLWYGRQPMIFATVTAENNITDYLLLLKQIVRERFSRIGFGNMVHTPDNVNELNAQLAGFSFGCAHCDYSRSDLASFLPIVEAYPAGTLLPSSVRDFDYLLGFLEPAWHDDGSFFRLPQSVTPLSVDGSTGNEHGLYLRFSPFELSYDNLVASLMSVAPALRVEHAIPIVFNGMLSPSNPLAVGAPESLARMRVELARHGVATSVQKRTGDTSPGTRG